jgi:hypothetical protein
VLSFVTAHNFAKHLKALKWKTPFQSICDAWKSNPSAFKINPHHLIPGPHNQQKGSPGPNLRKYHYAGECLGDQRKKAPELCTWLPERRHFPKIHLKMDFDGLPSAGWCGRLHAAENVFQYRPRRHVVGGAR